MTKIVFVNFMLISPQDQAKGQLREVVAHNVGGEIILANMIEQGKAICYTVNNHQFVRIVEHQWSDTQAMTQTTTVHGKSQGKSALGDATIESLADAFSSALEDAHQQKNEVLDISDSRVMRAHVDGLSLQRVHKSQLMIGNNSSGSGALKLWLSFFGCTSTRRSQNYFYKHFISQKRSLTFQ